MDIPRHPDQHDDPTPDNQPIRTRTMVIVVGVVTLVVLSTWPASLLAESTGAFLSEDGYVPW